MAGSDGAATGFAATLTAVSDAVVGTRAPRAEEGATMAARSAGVGTTGGARGIKAGGVLLASASTKADSNDAAPCVLDKLDGTSDGTASLPGGGDGIVLSVDVRDGVSDSPEPRRLGASSSLDGAGESEAEFSPVNTGLLSPSSSSSLILTLSPYP